MILAFASAGLSAASAYGAEAFVVPTTRIPGYPPLDDLVYRADPGEVNDVTISHDAAGTFTIEDRGAMIRAGRACLPVDPQRVVCRPARVSVYVTSSLGDGDDRISTSIAPGTPWTGVFEAIFGGPGNDQISLSATPARGAPEEPGSDITNRGGFRGFFAVRGDDGNDVVSGSADDDILSGGPGRDLLRGEGGDDVVAGGEDDDLLSGGARADFVLGSALEAFEFGLVQPADHDVVAGDSGADLLAGGPGGDQLAGGSGHDALLYAPRLSTRHQRLPKVRVKFDRLANDGPFGERDNVGQRDVEAAISLASGGVSITGRLAFRRGRYTLSGGRSTRATIILLSRGGTRAGQSGTFSGSSFSIRSGRLRGPITEIVPVGGSFRRCGRRATGRLANASQRQQLSPRTIRRLRARAKGRFRTRGRHSATTVRGTKWTVTERCDGTLTQVTSGTVEVQNLRRHATVIVRAGQSYLARAPSQR